MRCHLSSSARDLRRRGRGVVAKSALRHTDADGAPGQRVRAGHGGGRQPAGADKAFAPIPYFWSDQYETRIQAYGVFPAGADIAVLHGDLAGRRLVAAYGRQGTVVGVLGWNCPRELRRYR